ncbi:short-chain dehydrogenase/reductase-like protein [Rhexocercosporidium sp. MPI-PUGE-AT-0058]|nr:short-chain dehydrogenase/reductase-like protein [Rhexocercosporidium sp. MPI-PUGE-AT-0058]
MNFGHNDFLRPRQAAVCDGANKPRRTGDARPTALQIIQDEGLEGKMIDKVFLVTGTSAGIGPDTAKALAATGGKVFMTVRDMKKGEAACASFLEAGRSDRLNVLVCNAGIMAAPFSKTKDGFESQFGVNHLAHFLLFNLLKDTLLASSTPEFNSRVVTVASSGHQMGGVQFGNFSFEDGSYTPWGGYRQAKTANIYIANEIENRFGAKGLHGLSLHPGGIMTRLQKHVDKDMMASWDRPEINKIFKSTAQGAATTVFAAVSAPYEGKGRLYLEDCRPSTLTTTGDSFSGYVAHAFDKEKEAKLWGESLKMVGLSA